MNTLTKTQMRAKIRKLIGFPNSGKVYFSNDEMLRIVKKLNPTWQRQPKIHKGKQVTKRCFGKENKVWTTEHINILPEGVPKWTQQKVVGTHPNVANLKNILSQLKKVKNAKMSPLIQDIKTASRIVAQSKQQVKLNCDGESDLRNLAISVLSVDPGRDINICYDIV